MILHFMASELYSTGQIIDFGEQMSLLGHILTPICVFNQNYVAFSDWLAIIRDEVSSDQRMRIFTG